MDGFQCGIIDNISKQSREGAAVRQALIEGSKTMIAQDLLPTFSSMVDAIPYPYSAMHHPTLGVNHEVYSMLISSYHTIKKSMYNGKAKEFYKRYTESLLDNIGVKKKIDDLHVTRETILWYLERDLELYSYAMVANAGCEKSGVQFWLADEIEYELLQQLGKEGKLAPSEKNRLHTMQRYLQGKISKQELLSYQLQRYEESPQGYFFSPDGMIKHIDAHMMIIDGEQYLFHHFLEQKNDTNFNNFVYVCFEKKLIIGGAGLGLLSDPFYEGADQKYGFYEYEYTEASSHEIASVISENFGDELFAIDDFEDVVTYFVEKTWSSIKSYVIWHWLAPQDREKSIIDGYLQDIAFISTPELLAMLHTTANRFCIDTIDTSLRGEDAVENYKEIIRESIESNFVTFDDEGSLPDMIREIHDGGIDTQSALYDEFSSHMIALIKSIFADLGIIHAMDITKGTKHYFQDYIRDAS